MAFRFHNQGALIDPGADPAKTALIDHAGGVVRRFSFGDMDARANALARGLLRRGLARGDRVGILAANSAEYLTAFFGAQRAAD